MDKSWGVAPSTPSFRVRTNAGPEQRSTERAAAREQRARERAAAIEARPAARAVDRDADVEAREAARQARRLAEERLAKGDPHAAAAQRRRGSGRRDVVREHRDTRGYTTLVDLDRLRALAQRGTSIGGLARAFGLSEDEVIAALADAG